MLSLCWQAVGILSLLAEIAKTGAAELVQDNVSQFMGILDAANLKPGLSNNTVARKLMSKLRARVALRLLPARRRAVRRGTPVHLHFILQALICRCRCEAWGRLVN